MKILTILISSLFLLSCTKYKCRNYDCISDTPFEFKIQDPSGKMYFTSLPKGEIKNFDSLKIYKIEEKLSIQIDFYNEYSRLTIFPDRGIDTLVFDYSFTENDTIIINPKFEETDCCGTVINGYSYEVNDKHIVGNSPLVLVK